MIYTQSSPPASTTTATTQIPVIVPLTWFGPRFAPYLSQGPPVPWIISLAPGRVPARPAGTKAPSGHSLAPPQRRWDGEESQKGEKEGKKAGGAWRVEVRTAGWDNPRREVTVITAALRTEEAERVTPRAAADRPLLRHMPSRAPTYLLSMTSWGMAHPLASSGWLSWPCPSGLPEKINCTQPNPGQGQMDNPWNPDAQCLQVSTKASIFDRCCCETEVELLPVAQKKNLEIYKLTFLWKIEDSINHCFLQMMKV